MNFLDFNTRSGTSFPSIPNINPAEPAFKEEISGNVKEQSKEKQQEPPKDIGDGSQNGISSSKIPVLQQEERDNEYCQPIFKYMDEKNGSIGFNAQTGESLPLSSSQGESHLKSEEMSEEKKEDREQDPEQESIEEGGKVHSG